MREALIEILRSLVTDHGSRGHYRPPIHAGSRLREDLGLDSVAIVDLMVALETRLGVWFDPLDPRLVPALSTVGLLDRYVSGLLGEGAGG